MISNKRHSTVNLLMVLAFMAMMPVAFATPEDKTMKYEPTWESLNERPTPDWFKDAKLGIFIHWGVYAVPSYGPKGEYAENYAHWLYNVKRKEEVEFHNRVFGEDFPYKDFAPMFKAEFFNPDDWAALFHKAGARYVVLTSKHTDCFALWPAPDTTHWNSVEIGPKRDICGELTEAVRKKGMRMGFYYCLLEWHNPYSTLYKDDVDTYVETRMLPQLKDLVNRYKPSILWGDGEWDHPHTTWRSTEFLAWLFNEAPNRDYVAVNDRWDQKMRHQNGGYYTTEYGAGMKDVDHAWEENRGMGHSYGYNRNENLAEYRSAREIILMFVDLVSRGGNLLLNVGPTADGRIPVIMEERLTQLGQWLEVNGEAIYDTRPWITSSQWSAGEAAEVEYNKKGMRAKYDINDITGKHDDNRAVVEAFFTTKDNVLYAITPGWPGKTFTLNLEKPKGKVVVRLLGNEGPLPHQWSGDNLTIDLSNIEPIDLPCRWAYTFALSGL